MITSATEPPPDIEKPDKRVLYVWLASSSFGYGAFLLVISIPSVIFAITSKATWALWFIVLPVGLWIASVVALKKQWENWTFRLGPETLEMSHGWIWKQNRAVARDRIQHVDINSGPFDRRFGLVQLVVYTAGTTVGMIPGLRPERAERLRDELMAEQPIQ